MTIRSSPPDERVTALLDIDRVANRMTIAFLVGLASGASIAIRKALPVPRTALSVGASWAMVATACFGIERVSNAALRPVVGNYETRMYTSHLLGGSIAGGLVGQLFHFRVLPGVLVFTPSMVLVAFAELKFEEARNERLKRLLAAKEDDSDTTRISV
jgi:hypothetical protein